MAEEIEEVTRPETKKTGSSLNLDNPFEGLQFFYEKNKKAVNYGGGAIIAIIALFCAYKFYWQPTQEKEAADEIYFAQDYFNKDSFKLALNGGAQVQTSDGPKTMMGFTQVAEEFGSTKVGNLANYYAGVCYMQMGQYETAIEQLEKYDDDDLIVSCMAIGLIGDANRELNRVDDAISYYMKAAEKHINTFTTPMYLKKAGLAQEEKKNYTEAVALYERIKKEYGRTTEGRDIEKFISRAKTLGNL